MDQQQFEAQLKADGYTDIEVKSLQPRPTNDHHGHPYAVRGLVVAGTFTVIETEGSNTYREGQIFSVPANREHAEEIGSDGAKIVVGRKY